MMRTPGSTPLKLAAAGALTGVAATFAPPATASQPVSATASQPVVPRRVDQVTATCAAGVAGGRVNVTATRFRRSADVPELIRVDASKDAFSFPMSWKHHSTTSTNGKLTGQFPFRRTEYQGKIVDRLRVINGAAPSWITVKWDGRNLLTAGLTGSIESCSLKLPPLRLK